MTKKQSTDSPNRPVKSWRLRGVSVSVFENHTQADGKEIVFYKTSLQKTYKEGEEFKTTSSLGRDDLPIATLLLGRAWEFILEKEAESTRREDSAVEATR